MLVRLIRQTRREYFSSLVIKPEGNTKIIWDVEPDAIDLRSEVQILPDLVDQDRLHNLKDYFINIGRCLAEQLLLDLCTKQFLNPEQNIFVMDHIYLYEMFSMVQN